MFTSDQILDLEELPRTIAVVGAGIIGLEYASMFAALGIEVTLIDRRERLLEFVDHEIVDELVHQMRNANVTFRLNESVAQIQVQSKAPGRVLIALDSGKRVVADSVLYSIGRCGATRALNLPAAGLETDDRGRLRVDGEFRTKVKHIYAAGDVIGFPALASTSSEQGRRADRSLLGVHAIGTGATELIHIGQAVLALGGGLDYFLRTVFNYPTLAECYKVAALDAHNKLSE